MKDNVFFIELRSLHRGKFRRCSKRLVAPPYFRYLEQANLIALLFWVGAR